MTEPLNGDAIVRDIDKLMAELLDATRRAEQAEAEVKRQCAGRALEQNGLRNAVRLLGPAQEALARIEAVLSEHWDWKAGRLLHTAIRRALDGGDAS